MNTLNQLQQLSVNAAKNGDWKKAIDLNNQIIDIQQDNIGALNRLGLAYMQLNKKKKSKSFFIKTLEYDCSNIIAKKNIKKLKNNQKTSAVVFSKEQFIEEPGKSKIIELHRLADKRFLEKLFVGQKCSLKVKNRYICVECDTRYVGTLPEDLSFRLTKLIKRGNEYNCFIHSASGKICTVFIKECLRSKRNANINSFPISGTNIATINDIDEKFLLENNIPMQIVNTDTDSEKVIENVQPAENQ